MAEIYNGRYALADPSSGLTVFSMEGGELNMFGSCTKIKTTQRDSYPIIQDEPTMLKVENNIKEQLPTGLAVEVALAGVAIAVAVTEGAKLTPLACALGGVAIETSVATIGTAVSASQTGYDRNLEEHWERLTAGGLAGYIAGASVYGIIAAVPAAGKPTGMMFGTSTFTTIVVPDIIAKSKYGLAITSEVYTANDIYSNSSGYNVAILDKLFNNHIAAHETVNIMLDIMGDNEDTGVETTKGNDVKNGIENKDTETADRDALNIEIQDKNIKTNISETDIQEGLQIQNYSYNGESNQSSIDLEDLIEFATEGDLSFTDVTNLSSDKQEALRAIYYTLHNAGYSNTIIAGIMGSICTEGNIGQFEGIPYGSTAGYQNYHERTWNYPEYYLQFPHKYTNLELLAVGKVGKFPEVKVSAAHEYANSYSYKKLWEIPDFTVEEFKIMLNVGISDNVIIFGVGVLQSTDPSKHQDYIDAIDEFCTQHNLSMDTVIDKNLAIQLEAVYVKKRVEEIMSNDSKYQTEGPFLKKKSWNLKSVISDVSRQIPDVNNSDDLKNVCRAATYWYVEEEACSGAQKKNATNRAIDAVKCYNILKDYEAGR